MRLGTGDVATILGPDSMFVRYADLYVQDARRHQLPAHLAISRRAGVSTLEIVVSAAHAVYPVTIDPLITVGARTDIGAPGDSFNLGAAVALSSDGTVAVAGAPATHTTGAAFVFTRANGVWGTSPAAILSDSALAFNADFGTSVALDGTGNTILVGASGGASSTAGPGAADVFAEPSGGWGGGAPPTVISSPATRITISTLTGSAGLGSSVALDSNAGIALVGAEGAAGAGYIFLAPGLGGATGWGDGTTVHSVGTPTAALTDAALPGAGVNLGTSAALDGAGDVALLGAPGASNHSGVAGLYLEPAGGWGSGGTPAVITAPSARLSDATPGLGQAAFGTSVALSGDGLTALAGAPDANSEDGLADIFTQSSLSGWGSSTGTRVISAPQARLTDAAISGNNSDPQIGTAVALNGNGSVACVGAVAGGSSGHSPADVFVEPGGTWSSGGTASLTIPTARLSDPALDAKADTLSSGLGSSVAISGDGASVLAGGPGAYGSAGAADVFSEPSSGTPSWGPGGTTNAITVPTATLLETTTKPGQFFGNAVALSANGTIALIGALGSAPFQTGTAYLYQQSVASGPPRPR